MYALILFALFSRFASADSLRLECAADGTLTRYASGAREIVPEHVPLELPGGDATCQNTRTCYENALGLPRGELGNVGQILELAGQKLMGQMLKAAQEDCEPIAAVDNQPHLPPTFTLTYPYPGPNKNKASSSMPTDIFKDIAKNAVDQGLDPYLAMAVVLMENDPTEETFQGYAANYGSIPVDGYPAYSFLGCMLDRKSPDGHLVKPNELAAYQAEKDEARAAALREAILSPFPADVRPFAEYELNCDKSCPGRMVRQRMVPDLDMSGGAPNTETRAFCTTNDHRALAHGGSPEFTMKNEVNPSECCVNVHVPAGEGDVYPSEVYTALGAAVIKSKVTRNLKPGGDSLSFAIQRYNGLGIFGSTEHVNSSCMGGLNMAKTPVYGARTADLMVTSLMNNHVLQQLVSQALHGRKLPSVFCQSQGAGSHAVDGRQFLEEQKRYLAGRAACQKWFR
jgi:hypothetical protein